MNTEQASNEVRGVGKSIAAAFVKAQADFGPALKSNTNPHFKSRYAGLDACIEAVIDALHKHGIALVQRTLPCESGVTVETVLIHSSGETLSGGPLHVPASKNDPQGYGSALTYARRYSLMATCGIAAEDDDGNAASRPVTYAAPRRPTARTTDEIESMAADVIKLNRPDKPLPPAKAKAKPEAAPSPEDDDDLPF
jgi:hypothetical protein